MFNDEEQAHQMTAAEAREHVAELEAERALAVTTGVASVASYMRDLEAEIDTWRHVYVTTAVTEIATLRAELFGPKLG
jgi:trans-aconitate methyltransferase